MAYNNLQKQIIIENLDIDFSDIDNLWELIAECQIQRPLNSLHDIKIYESYSDVDFYTERLETDEEYEKRIKPYTAKLRAKEEKERKEYERLKAKFEGVK